MPIAEDLFARIVNIPCQPGMADLSDDQIVEVLSGLG